LFVVFVLCFFEVAHMNFWSAKFLQKMADNTGTPAANNQQQQQQHQNNNNGNKGEQSERKRKQQERQQQLAKEKQQQQEQKNAAAAKSNNNGVKVNNEPVFKRINFMQQAAHLMMHLKGANEHSQEQQENLSRFYMHNVRKIAARNVVRMYVI